MFISFFSKTLILFEARGGEDMSIKVQVLDTIKAAGKPVTAGEVEKLSGLNRKDIDKAFTELKKENAIVSPVRCKWEAAE
jgi:hypothetical protein